MRDKATSRRRFLALVPAAALALITGPRPIRAHTHAHRLQKGGPKPHPKPRPGIDGSNVLPEGRLVAVPDVIPIYDGIREIPEIADGIHCYCGCAEAQGMRSLLVCYEESGLAMFCNICQGQGELVVRRAEEGQSLEQIRRAIDARFGHGV